MSHCGVVILILVGYLFLTIESEYMLQMMQLPISFDKLVLIIYHLSMCIVKLYL